MITPYKNDQKYMREVLTSIFFARKLNTKEVIKMIVARRLLGKEITSVK